MDHKEFIDYLEGGEKLTVKYTTDERKETGGYLVPKYTYENRPGLVGWFWRRIGRIFNHENLYERGLVKIEFAKQIVEMIENHKKKYKGIYQG